MDPATLTPLGVLAAALLLDLIAGEFPRWAHPVVAMGTLIAGLLRLAPASGWWRQFLYGSVLVAVVVGFWVGAALVVMRLSGLVPIAGLLPVVWLLKASFALRELGAAAERVRGAVETANLPAAREALRSLCSRDPSQLDGEALLAATIQSLAENASDSFVAPLFYYALLGLPGAVGYRAVNTLDAMIGYRGKFEALGKTAARLDDLANLIPARLTAFLLLLAGGSGASMCGAAGAAGGATGRKPRVPMAAGRWPSWPACWACAWKNRASIPSASRGSPSSPLRCGRPGG